MEQEHINTATQTMEIQSWQFTCYMCTQDNALTLASKTLGAEIFSAKQKILTLIKTSTCITDKSDIQKEFPLQVFFSPTHTLLLINKHSHYHTMKRYQILIKWGLSLPDWNFCETFPKRTFMKVRPKAEEGNRFQ